MNTRLIKQYSVYSVWYKQVVDNAQIFLGQEVIPTLQLFTVQKKKDPSWLLEIGVKRSSLGYCCDISIVQSQHHIHWLPPQGQKSENQS